MTEAIHFIEPALATKRQSVIDKRFGKSTLRADEIQDRLLALRKHAVKNTLKNLRALRKHANHTDQLSLHFAKTPAEVVEHIITECNGTGYSKVAMNRSNTMRGLEPELIKSGFELIHTYDNAVRSGDLGVFTNIDGALANYRLLRGLEPENTFRSFDLNTRPLVYPANVLSNGGSGQDLIGVIGANVLTTSGEIVIVQHLYNISSIITHAKKLFVVITVDKLVDSFDSARFQARCSAMYGFEQIILDLYDQDTQPRAVKNDKKIEYENYRPPGELHVIVLDDGRRNMLGTKHEDLLYCIGCRKCGVLCPRIRASPRDGAANKSTLTARELIMDGYLYGVENALEGGLFDCTLCRTCSAVCPVGIELTDRLLDLREQCQKADLFSEPHKRIRNNIMEFGNAYGAEHTTAQATSTRTSGRGRRKK